MWMSNKERKKGGKMKTQLDSKTKYRQEKKSHNKKREASDGLLFFALIYVGLVVKWPTDNNCAGCFKWTLYLFL